MIACETCGRGLTRPTDMSARQIAWGLHWRRSATDKHIHIVPLTANRNWMENKSASCLSDHLRYMSVVQHAESNPIFQAAANHDSPFRPPPYFRGDSLTPTCVSHGNSDPSPPGNSYPSMGGSRHGRRKLQRAGLFALRHSQEPASRCHATQPTTANTTTTVPRSLSSVTCMLEQLSCAPHWSC
jgi:hypothetical protein